MNKFDATDYFIMFILVVIFIIFETKSNALTCIDDPFVATVYYNPSPPKSNADDEEVSFSTTNIVVPHGALDVHGVSVSEKIHGDLVSFRYISVALHGRHSVDNNAHYMTIPHDETQDIILTVTATDQCGKYVSHEERLTIKGYVTPEPEPEPGIPVPVLQLLLLD